MLLKRLVSPDLGAPPTLSPEQFHRRKLFVLLYSCVWLGVLIFLYITWSDLPSIVKYVLAIAELVFAPDFLTLKEMFAANRAPRSHRD